MIKTQILGSFLVLASLLVACGNPNGAPPASPNNDVQPPTTTTGNGEVMGADRVPPAQKLDEGPKLDAQEGLKPAKRPGGD
jgi:hypothetical protein